MDLVENNPKATREDIEAARSLVEERAEKLYQEKVSD